MAIPSQDLKVCTQCQLPKNRKDDFYFNGHYQRFQAECKQCTKARRLKYYNSEKKPQIQGRFNAQMKIKLAKVKEAVFLFYGGYRCVCCGETEPAFLTLDHTGNDGASHRKTLGGRNKAGYHTYIWLFRNGFPPGFQILCMNCQQGKRMCGGICPHEVRRNDYPLVGVEPSGSKCIAAQAVEDIV